MTLNSNPNPNPNPFEAEDQETDLSELRRHQTESNKDRDKVVFDLLELRKELDHLQSLYEAQRAKLEIAGGKGKEKKTETVETPDYVALNTEGVGQVAVLTAEKVEVEKKNAKLQQQLQETLSDMNEMQTELLALKRQTEGVGQVEVLTADEKVVLEYRNLKEQVAEEHEELAVQQNCLLDLTCQVDDLTTRNEFLLRSEEALKVKVC